MAKEREKGFVAELRAALEGDDADDIRAALRKAGAPDRLETLMHENYRYRERLRAAADKIEDLEGRVEGLDDDSVILTADEAKAWKSYGELGKPEELKERLEEGAKAVADNVKRAEREKLEAAAKALGINGPLLVRLAESDGLTVHEMREEGEGDDARVVPIVTVGEGDDAKREKLADYARREWGDFATALGTVEETEDSGDARGTPWAEQPGQLKPPSGKAPTVEELAGEKARTGEYAQI